MTAPAQQRVTIRPVPNSRLEQLLAQYEQAKAAADEAGKTLKAITDGIKLELTNAAPGATSIDVTGELLTRPLRLHAKESWRVDAKKLKAEDPATYVRYATKSVVWELRAVGGAA